MNRPNMADKFFTWRTFVSILLEMMAGGSKAEGYCLIFVENPGLIKGSGK
jgi:hypothetical protein